MALPHDRSSLLWNDGPTDRFTKSMERWINAMYSDDPSNIDVITAGRSISRIIAKENGVLSGRPVLDYLIENHCNGATIVWNFTEGQGFQKGQEIVSIVANSDEILRIERICMNLITRLSGIASTTSKWSEQLGGVSLAATRKTNWGILDKWAVHIGGGLTHRLDRSDGLMIKENDFSLAKLTLEEILSTCRTANDFPVIEVESSDQALSVVNSWIGLQTGSPSTHQLTLMMDNLGPENCRKFSDRLEDMGLRQEFVLEGSGRVRWENLQDWAQSGVDVVSSGSITMEPQMIDMTMLMEAS